MTSSASSEADPSGAENIGEYFQGRKLYGDDFERTQLEKWYEDEQEGYAKLAATTGRPRGYTSHLKNVRYGYRFLPQHEYDNVLGFGSADGAEFLPVLPLLRKIAVVEPTDVFVRSRIGNVPVTYFKPSADGQLPFDDNTFDLATSFGALHHVASVSRVVTEIYRCLRPGGFLLIEEPTVSMGDWRNARKGLTKRERGIPLNVFRQIIRGAGFDVVRERRILFSGTAKLSQLIHLPLWSHVMPLAVDECLCRLFYRNEKYHPRNLLEWLMPTNVFYVLRKSPHGPRHYSDSR